MTYSDFILDVAATMTSQTSCYLCLVLADYKKQYSQHDPQHAARLERYIEKLLRKEHKLRGYSRPDMAINRVLAAKYGSNYNPLQARIDLLQKLAAYHKARGD